MASMLEKSFQAVQSNLRMHSNTAIFNLAAIIDLTCLNEQATPKDIIDLAEKALQSKVAAVCLFPEHLKLLTINNVYKRATVANFPTGIEEHEHVMHRIEQDIVHSQADEIDYVFNYQAYLNGEIARALGQCHEAFQLCKQYKRIFKVILETGALPSMEFIYHLSLQILEYGCDFLKTSTGKIAVGATLPAAFAILNAIQDSQHTCGIKISGGIRAYEQALNYMQLAETVLDKPVNSSWFRIGTSILIEDNR